MKLYEVIYRLYKNLKCLPGFKSMYLLYLKYNKIVLYKIHSDKKIDLIFLELYHNQFYARIFS